MICASQLQPPPRPSPAAVLADAYRAPKYRAACLPSPRAQAKPGAGRPSHSAPAHQTRTTALPPSRTDAKASRVDTSLSLLPMPKTKTRAAQVRTFRRLTYPAKPTRRLFAQLLKPLLICSSCVLPSTFHYTLHFFGESSLLRKWFIENELTAPAEQAHTAAVPTEKSEPRFSEGSLLRNEPQYPMMWYALHIFSFAKKWVLFWVY